MPIFSFVYTLVPPLNVVLYIIFSSMLLCGFCYSSLQPSQPSPVTPTYSFPVIPVPQPKVGSIYGFDVSYPTLRTVDKFLNSSLPLQVSSYSNLMMGCVEEYGDHCYDTENMRMRMNAENPGKYKNFTTTGYLKTRLPTPVYNRLRAFYLAHRSSRTPESWPFGNTFVNHWSSPTYMVSFEDSRFQPESLDVRNSVNEAVKQVLEEWAGVGLTHTATYGVRVYGNGSVLAPHADSVASSPRVISAIIQVFQGEGEDWPLEVYGHDGRARNVTMEEGDLVLYESHTVVHGRPFMRVGDEFANVFVHFEPVGGFMKEIMTTEL